MPQCPESVVAKHARVAVQHPAQVAAVQVFATHAPATQDCDGSQATHSPASAPQAKSWAPVAQWPAESMHPTQGALVQAKLSHRSPAAQVAQKVIGGPHASGAAPVVHWPSGAQHPTAHQHASPPSARPGVRRGAAAP